MGRATNRLLMLMPDDERDAWLLVMIVEGDGRRKHSSFTVRGVSAP